jgi:hypothetical protein
MANALFADSTVGTGDATPSATRSDQQAVLTANASKLAAFSKIVSYGINDGGPEPTAADFDLIGVTGVAGPGGAVDVYSNIALVNQSVYSQSNTWAPTIDEVQALVAPAALLAKISQYQLVGESLNQAYGELFNYTTAPRDAYGGVDSDAFIAGLVQGVWTENNSGANQVQYHFDITSGGNDGRYVDFWNIVAGKPAIVGWQDNSGYYTENNLLQSIRVHHRDESWTEAAGRMPSTFDVEGFNAESGQWELIKHFEREPLKNTSGNPVALTTKATLAQLPDYQTYSINATKPYAGYRISVTENIEVAGGTGTTYSGAGSMLGVDEISFMVKNSSTVTLKPTLAEYQAAGLTSVTEELVNAMNQLVQSGYRVSSETAAGSSTKIITLLASVGSPIKTSTQSTRRSRR